MYGHPQLAKASDNVQVIGGPGGAERAAMLDRFDRLLQSPDQDDGRFDDAEEE